MSAIKHAITVGLWFDRRDVERLRELSTTSKRPEDRDAFKVAANATENGMCIVYQTMTRDNLALFIALFTNEGITAPLVTDLEPSERGLKLRA